MTKPVLFIHGAGEGAYEEDGLLVASLQQALGPGYLVYYPRMPHVESPEYSHWKARISSELASLGSGLTLVGHSAGGSVLLKYLTEQQVENSIVGVFVIAAPYWGADNFWKWDEVQLSDEASDRLSSIPRIFLYHSRDDDVVPFVHLELYSAQIPTATVREVDGRGHQLGNDLADVAKDIVGQGTL